MHIHQHHALQHQRIRERRHQIEKQPQQEAERQQRRGDRNDSAQKGRADRHARSSPKDHRQQKAAAACVGCRRSDSMSSRSLAMYVDEAHRLKLTNAMAASRKYARAETRAPAASAERSAHSWPTDAAESLSEQPWPAPTRSRNSRSTATPRERRRARSAGAGFAIIAVPACCSSGRSGPALPM